MLSGLKRCIGCYRSPLCPGSRPCAALSPSLTGLESAWQTSSDSLRVKLLIGLSSQYQNIDFSKAEEYADEALRLAEDRKMEWAKIESYKRTSKLAEITGDYTRALKYANLELQAALVKNDSLALYSALNYIGYDYNDLGQFDEAYYYFTQSFRVANKLRDSLSIAIALHNIGSVFKELGQYEIAINHLNLSRTISEKVPATLTEALIVRRAWGCLLAKR